ncbi:hypothetical protein C211_19954 [Stutzerimonas degradans]|nr:hypothetical protein C211_19954 [Stutzerimonas degradans]
MENEPQCITSPSRSWLFTGPLSRPRRLAGEVQLGIDVVLDQRHLMALQQLVELLLLRLAHARAERVLQAAHEPAGLDRQVRQAVGEHVQIDAFTRMHGNFHRLELEPFQHLERGVEGRRLDGHQIARLGHHLQAEVQRLHGAGGDHQLVHRQHHAADHVAQGDLSAQIGIAGSHLGDHLTRRHVAHALRHRARQAWQREQFGAGKGRTERHRGRIAQGGEYRKHQFADVHIGGFRGARADLRLVQRTLDVFADEIARTRPRLNQPAILQQVVRLEHRGRADAVGAAGMPHRGHLLSGGEHAAADQLGNLVGEFFVALHRGPGGSG